MQPGSTDESIPQSNRPPRDDYSDKFMTPDERRCECGGLQACYCDDTEKSDAASGRLGNNGSIVVADRHERKEQRFKQLANAQKILDKNHTLNTKETNPHATRTCFRWRHSDDNIELHVTGTEERSNAYYSGLQTCSSVWCCPVCAHRIAQEKTDKMRGVMKYAESADLLPIMVTLTARHNRYMKLDDFKEKFKSAYRYLKQLTSYRTMLENIDVQHSVRAAEVKYSLKNGWHYHLHVLMLLPRNIVKSGDKVAEFTEKLPEKWLSCLNRYDLTGIDEIACNVKADDSVPEHYLSKLGLQDDTTTAAGLEISGGQRKMRGGFTIWQILDAAYDNNIDADQRARFERLYLEYATSMTGDNWITCSHGLNALIEDVELDETDETDDETEELVISIPDEIWRYVTRSHAQGRLLTVAAKTRDEKAVRRWLDGLKQLHEDHEQQQIDQAIEELKEINQEISEGRLIYNRHSMAGTMPDAMYWKYERLFARKREIKKLLKSKKVNVRMM